MSYVTSGFFNYTVSTIVTAGHRWYECDFNNFKYVYITIDRSPSPLSGYIKTRAVGDSTSIRNIYWAVETGETGIVSEYRHTSPGSTSGPFSRSYSGVQTSSTNMGVDFQHDTTYKLSNQNDDFVSYDWIYTNIPMFYYNDIEGIDLYINNGDTSHDVNPNNREYLHADWTVAYTNATNTQYSLACNIAQFYDNTSVFYGMSDVARIHLNIDYNIGTELVSVYSNEYAYGQTWSDTLTRIIGDSNLDIASQIANKIATLLDIDRIQMRFYVSLPDGTITARGYVNFDHQNVLQYGFIDTVHGDTINFKSGVVLDDTDSDISNPEIEEETSDTEETKNVSQYSGTNILYNTYALSPQECRGIGSYLWGADFLTDIKLVNNNPIENIISCKLFPIDFEGQQSQNFYVYIGNCNTETIGGVLPKNVFMYESNPLKIERYFGNKKDNLKFLDYAPYTKIEIMLPFIGIKEMPTDTIMGKSVKLRWWLDVVTGTLETDILLLADESYHPLLIFNSQIGVDIPLTAQNLAQVQAGYIQNAIGGGFALASGNVAGAVSAVLNGATQQYHSQTQGTPSPACSVQSNLTPELIITRPKIDLVGTVNYSNNTRDINKAYRDIEGSPCFKVENLGGLDGYTEVENAQDLAIDGALNEEVNEIIRLLSDGVILHKNILGGL